MKYGHASFSTTILEYCEKSELNEREQYYLDNLEPDYNILKTAGSFLGYTFTDEDKVKISKGLKGIKRSEDTKELMRQKALGRKPSVTQAPALLTRQVTAPVRWVETLERLRALGVTRFLEFGSGKVLTGLAKRTLGEVEALAVTDLKSLEEALR